MTFSRTADALSASFFPTFNSSTVVKLLISAWVNPTLNPTLKCDWSWGLKPAMLAKAEMVAISLL